MDNHEAKFILQAYRPDGSDASDADFREALEQAERDPELAAWFREERAFDEAFSAKLAEVPVPPHLKEEILAGQKVVPGPAWWKQPVVLTQVAAVVLLLVAGLFVGSSLLVPTAVASAPMEWHDFQHHAMDMFKQPMSLKKMTRSSEEARAWLAQMDAPRGFVLPEGMRAEPTVGCSTMEMDGHPVSLVCFDTGKGELVHLFVLHRKAVSDPPPPSQPVFHKEGQWSTASWSEGDLSLMLASKAPMAHLQELFGGAPLSLAW